MSPEVKAPATPVREEEIDIQDTEDEEFEDEDEGEEEEFEDDDEEMDFGEEGYDGMEALGGLLSATLATEEGDTVCTALLDIGTQLATQNKILLKILSTLNKKDN